MTFCGFKTIESLSPADRQLFNIFGRGASVKIAYDCVHHAFEHQATLNPANVAVEDVNGQKLTYAELDRQANCLANCLRDKGVIPGSRVCLLVERSVWLVVGIVGILKAGGAYVPLDGNVVSDKTLEYALEDSGSSVALVQSKFKGRIRSETTVLVLENTVHTQQVSEHCVKPHDLSMKMDSCYTIYTSGTTGLPKGVDVMHKNVSNLICNAPGNLRMAPGIRVSQLMNISFDMAQWEILGAMANGATLCLRGKTSKEWRAVMKTVNVVIATPSMLAPHPPEEYPMIKVVAVAGEPCPKALADNWAKRVNFYNCCGPTEITIVNTMHLHSPGKPLGIGGPTPNNTACILDENMRPVKIGEMGVMWAGGAGITRGYLNLPEKTAEKYQRDPFLDDGSIMFNTGDLGRWMPNGNLEHLGRVDHQVKVKGFRVELDGVAAAMESTPGVKVAAAILVDQELWGFFAPSNVSAEDIKAMTSKVQPQYAVPTQYHGLDNFPETANGKSDRRALERIARAQLAVPSLASAASPSKDITPAPCIPAPAAVRPHVTKAIAAPCAFPPPGPKPLTLVSRFTTPISQPPIAVHTLFTPATPPVLNLDLNKSTVTIMSNAPTLVGIPVEKSIEPSKLEGQTSIWAGYEQDVLPKKEQARWLRNFRHQIFYLYRRLFSVVFVINFAIFVWYAVEGATTRDIGTVVAANLTVAVLMRQEYVIDAFYIVSTAIPRTWPMAIRRVCARVYHLGGLHSGGGVSGTLWLILFCAKATQEYVRRTGISGATLCFSYAILIFLCTILVFVYPSNRKKAHDTFETTHRFLGWASVTLVWGQTLLLANDNKGTNTFTESLTHSPPFWLVIVQTTSLILPWLRLAKVPVRCEKLSNHAVRMYFDYATPGIGSFVRLSDSPLMEWHSFATISEPGKQGFSIVVSRAGDWTAKMIAKPPTHIWKRGLPTYGVIRIAQMFNRIVLVATGSGIGPCAPALLRNASPIRLLWTAPNVRETFGDKLVDQVLKANPQAVIYNTREHGKPDMVKLTWRLVREFNAEAVIIISNQPLTEKVVYGMVSRGVPAFGAIWDS